MAIQRTRRGCGTRATCLGSSGFAGILALSMAPAAPQALQAAREPVTLTLVFLRTWQSDRLPLDWTDSVGDRIRGALSVDKLGITRLPRGPAGRAGTLGGSGLGVSRASPHPREALELVRFLSRRRIERRHAPPRNAGPALPEVYDLPALVTAPNGAGPARRSIDMVARPSIVAGPKYEAVARAFIRAVHSVLTGETSASQAAATAEKDLVQITGFKKGPPRARSNP